MRRVPPRHLGFVCESCAFTRTQAAQSPISLRLSSQTTNISQRLGRTLSTPRWSSTVASNVSSEHEQIPAVKQTQAINTPAQVTEPADLARLAEDSKKKFLSVDGIPAAQLTNAALESCLRAAIALHPQLKRAEAQSKASASKLVTLGAERTGARIPIETKIQEAVNRISYSAYTIITHPNVEMTPEFLETYVEIQSQLGRPESLPSVLELYSSKPKPVVKDGQIQYIPQKPNAASRAIEEGVAATALQTAIDAKNLDASLGIIEAAYTVPAFKRQKLIRHGTAPAIGLATLPFGIFGLSTAYAAYWQNTMDISTATGIGVAGISGYFFIVGSLGVIAKLSNKDQMKRVTWAPGTPLRYRWLREDERAALDKVACAWGYKEPWRHGEETGPEWEGLKEYMGYRQMLLDRVEFMEGMS
ncbi:major facilitator superfamily domain-containing protein [Pochonia chlamydosporia 170]|uniref:Major facilitator superfamily domain-containing protein n=1 Tax=Pochonia chlamydosporia 170 TaxID=1380566 RepID=A0A179G475_METCM|nr:major facilitator superfamily domain-containing protein [Pochonia chlamydosporia 170]OAQ72597.1 major facilitator superfamily domain-containing protein [Pochonia chlamydosporia 170]